MYLLYVYQKPRVSRYSVYLLHLRQSRSVGDVFFCCTGGAGGRGGWGWFFFFFQAEDGIRDLVRSRGLGDVYKRQVYQLDQGSGGTGFAGIGILFDRTGNDVYMGNRFTPVSYTHLTLPTSDLV